MSKTNVLVRSADTVASSSGVKLVLYGESGAGKTVLAATCPSPIVISAESGLLSLKRRNIERIFGVGNSNIVYEVPTICIKSMQDLGAAFEYVRQPGVCGTVFLDSISEIAEIVLSDEKAVAKDPRKAYGEMQDTLIDVIRDFREIVGKHVVMTAKLEWTKEQTGSSRFYPSMPGQKLSQMLPYHFDEVWRLVVGKDAQGNVLRALQTGLSPDSYAKDRSGALAMYEEAHLGLAFQKILGDVA